MCLARGRWNLVASHLAWSWQPFVFTEYKFRNIGLWRLQVEVCKAISCFYQKQQHWTINVQSVYFCCSKIRRNSLRINFRELQKYVQNNNDFYESVSKRFSFELIQQYANVSVCKWLASLFQMQKKRHVFCFQ